jgi:hypothetical protein
VQIVDRVISNEEFLAQPFRVPSEEEFLSISKNIERRYKERQQAKKKSQDKTEPEEMFPEKEKKN